jgi:hypothetical protein
MCLFLQHIGCKEWIRLRRMRVALLSAVVCCAVCLFGGIIPTREAYAQQKTISATVQFRVVSATDFSTLRGARVIVVGPDGRVLRTGLTDANGQWSVPLTVPLDPRFGDIGIVTAICVANGHNENVVFEVPVKQGTVQPITLYPIRPKLRNEAFASLGQLHHLDVIDIVNRYAQELGLTKQPGIVGEQGYSPWSPNIRPGR